MREQDTANDANSPLVDLAWFINKPSEVDEDHLGEFLASGKRIFKNPAPHQTNLEDIKVGDRVALKSNANRKRDIPFFHGDALVSVMTIYATGTVRNVDIENAELRIDWDARFQPKHWFLFTAISALWRVERGRHKFAGDLLDFTFHNVPQALERFLAEPFWSRRYSVMPQFTWIPMYEAIATRLRDFANDRQELLRRLQEAAQHERYLQYLTSDQYSDGTSGPLRDVDPFTVLGVFNRGLTHKNRRRLVRLIADIVGAEAPEPEDFQAVPVLNNQRAWFISFEHQRKPDDVDKLWEVFLAALDFAGFSGDSARERFIAAHDAALEVRGVQWNLSVGLFWARPHAFMPLDRRSREMLAQLRQIKAPKGGSSYLELLSDLQASFNRTTMSSFPLLSYAAYTHFNPPVPQHSVAGFAEWGSQFLEWIDSEAQEDSYKRRVGRLLGRARDQIRDGVAGWPSTFIQGLEASKQLLRPVFKDKIRKVVEADPDAASDVLEIIWNLPTADSFDEFHDELYDLLGRVTQSQSTSLAALLCLAADPENNAPYIANVTERWYALANFESNTKTEAPSERYATLLRFLDALITEVWELNGLRISRLEAQGLSWMVSNQDPPAEWEETTKQQLSLWRSEEPLEPGPRAWLLRPAGDLGSRWVEDGLVTHSDTLGSGLVPGADFHMVSAEVRATHPQMEQVERDALAQSTYLFNTEMNSGDYVGVTVDGILHIGRLEGPLQHFDGPPSELQRRVLWEGSHPLSQGTPEAISSLLDEQGRIVEITDSIDWITEMLNNVSAPFEAAPEIQDEPSQVMLPPITEALADKVHMDTEPLEEITDLLRTRKQVIFYGPPGTGKTYLALALAKHLVGVDHSSHAQLVQFHPSYSYEDFFEGYRPAVTEDGQATFKVEPGPLSRIASEARSNKSKPFFLIIDEINRANLAKVFGELYFLLEYRDQSIRLQYRPDTVFRLPENLYIIGTMNTADRSIAMIDAAMRRRFAFIELHPAEPPVKDVLARAVADLPNDNRPRLLTLLNERIGETDWDMQVGPSYLMREQARTRRGLEQIWQYDILPLLEEHYYGRMSRSEVYKRFSLASLIAEIEQQDDSFGEDH